MAHVVMPTGSRVRADAGRSGGATAARRTAAATAVLALALTACGQKPGVHVEGVAAPALAPVAQQPATSGGPATSTSSTDATTTTSGDAASAPDASTATSSTTASTTPSSSAPATSGSQGTQASSDGEQQAAQPDQPQQPTTQVRGSDRTGVSADVIRLGTHAPVTGAAPLPATSFEKSGDLYWRNLIERQGQTVLGRTKIEYLFRDDRYDPNAARQVCRELEAETFIFAGGGGTDQIQACGEFARAARAPYFSAGVTEAGLRGNEWYFASSMSYKQQGPLLAQLVATNPDTRGKRVGAIITDTPNFDDAVEGWEAGVAAEGLDYYKTLRHPKGDTSWYNSYANDFAEAGVEVVFILSSPVDYIRLAQQANQNGITFQYVGVGVSMGLNAVLRSGCDDVDGGIFFSPFPGLDWVRQNDPAYFEAGQHFGVPTDDIAYALWGISASLHGLFQQYGQAYGTDLTREDFRDMVENATIESGIFPTVTYTPEDHFGATSVHVLQADCSTGEYKTIHTFASSF